jgi:hypothetical protein
VSDVLLPSLLFVLSFVFVLFSPKKDSNPAWNISLGQTGPLTTKLLHACHIEKIGQLQQNIYSALTECDVLVPFLPLERSLFCFLFLPREDL